jgi:hypothetical protein
MAPVFAKHMKTIAQIASWLALAATILPPALFLGGGMELSQVQSWMLIGTVLWFVATPLWMERKT